MNRSDLRESFESELGEPVSVTIREDQVSFRKSSKLAAQLKKTLDISSNLAENTTIKVVGDMTYQTYAEYEYCRYKRTDTVMIRWAEIDSSVQSKGLFRLLRQFALETIPDNCTIYTRVEQNHIIPLLKDHGFYESKLSNNWYVSES